MHDIMHEPMILNIGSINACVPFFNDTTRHWLWGDTPRGLGTIVVTLKPSGEACQTGGECINHPHHIPYSRIIFLTFYCPVVQFPLPCFGPLDL